MTGEIVNLKRGNGGKLSYGFIRPSNCSGDLFFHASNVLGDPVPDLTVGMTVEFQRGLSDRHADKYQAIDVKVTA